MKQPSWETCAKCATGTCTSAYHWAARNHGVLLDGENKGAIGGDRLPSLEKRQRAALEPIYMAEARDLHEWIAVLGRALRRKLASLDSDIAAKQEERARFAARLEDVTLFEKTGRLFVEGKTEKEIARSIGYGSHSAASELIQRIKDESLRLFRESADVVVYCRRPKCGKVVERCAATGRFAEYCEPRCENAHAQARFKTRRRAVVSLTVPITDKDCQQAPA